MAVRATLASGVIFRQETLALRGAPWAIHQLMAASSGLLSGVLPSLGMYLGLSAGRLTRCSRVLLAGSPATSEGPLRPPWTRPS